MAKEGLRDKLGNRIGEIESDSSGKQIGRDMSLNRVGEYVLEVECHERSEWQSRRHRQSVV